jgi:hypothetical protein
VSPTYVAVIVCDPSASAEVVNAAVLLAVIAILPSRVVPSRKLMLPVGAIVPAVVTVAVNVTDCPITEGFSELATAVVVTTAPTTCVSAAEVEVT